MKLISAHVTNYRSILDSGEFRIDPVTCLVGKNEAGKTAILQALERLNPLNGGSKKYDKLIDYPRRNLTAYAARHPDGDARVITTSWELEAADIEAVEDEFGEGAIRRGEPLRISKSYESETSTWDIPFDEAKAIGYLVQNSGLTTDDQQALANPKTSAALLAVLNAVATPADGHNKLKARIDSYRDKRATLKALDLLKEQWPKFLYSSSFDRMPGKVSVNQMKQPRQPNQAGRASENEERIFQAFLDMAGTTLDELDQAPKLEELTAKLEAASNTITETIFEYWTQNTSLEIEVKAQQGRPQDPPPFNTGTVVEARVKNTIHKMTVPFSERSVSDQRSHLDGTLPS